MIRYFQPTSFDSSARDALQGLSPNPIYGLCVASVHARLRQLPLVLHIAARYPAAGLKSA